MADILVSISTFSDSETKFISGGGSEQLVPGDRLGFRWDVHTGPAQPSSVFVSGWDASAWTNAASATLSLGGGYVYHTVLSSPAEVADILTISATLYDSATYTANVSSGIDSIADQFDLGAAVVGANPGNTYLASSFLVSGLSVGNTVTASASNTGEISKDGQATFTSGSFLVENGDRVWTRLTASSNYGTSVTTSVSVGSVTDFWAVATLGDPATGTILQFGHSTGSVPLSDIKSFFGGGNNLDSYRRNEFVPTISPENDSVTDNPAVNLTLLDFRDTITSFYWSVPPSNKQTSGDTMQGPITALLSWQSTTDWQLGYGPGMTEICEYKFEFLSQFKETLASGGGVANTDVQMNSVSYTAWGANNKNLVITVTPDEFTEAFYYGTIRCSARNPVDTSIVVTSDIQYNYAFSAN